jgi:putative oligomerization/nucleic acid binding protein
MPLGRRRPIMRAAAVGTVAYQGSKRGAMAGEAQAEQTAPAPEASQAPAAVPASEGVPEEIEQLAKLHASGALTDEEFAAAKAKALGIA